MVIPGRTGQVPRLAAQAGVEHIVLLSSAGGCNMCMHAPQCEYDQIQPAADSQTGLLCSSLLWVWCAFSMSPTVTTLLYAVQATRSQQGFHWEVCLVGSSRRQVHFLRQPRNFLQVTQYPPFCIRRCFPLSVTLIFIGWVNKGVSIGAARWLRPLAAGLVQGCTAGG